MSWIARCNGQRAFGNACNTVASLTENFLAFATVLQVPRKTFRRLQHRCKSHEKLFGVCGSPASPTGNALVFAGAPQVSRETFWCLRESRKCLGKLFGVCGSPASPTGNALAFAGVLQAFPKTFWLSKLSADSILTPNSRFVDEQKAREGAVLMRSPCQRPLARRGEIKTASIFAAAKRKNDGSVAQLDRATAF